MAALLLVDEDLGFREPLAQALRRGGWEVDGAESVSAVLGVLEERPYDLCVVDLGVGDADRLLDAAVATPVPVVITSPHGDLLELAAHRHPAARPLPKPYRAAQLLACLADAV